MGSALPANSTVIGWPVTRLPHFWIEAEIADQLLWRGEASDVANGCEHTERNDRVDAPNRHQSFHSFVTQSVFGEALFVSGELDGDAIVFIKMATNKPPLILRKWLSVEPSPAALAEQLAGIVRNQVCVQDASRPFAADLGRPPPPPPPPVVAPVGKGKYPIGKGKGKAPPPVVTKG